ncbi:MAG: cysteine desulfurase [Eubacteriaceae bacterium]|nr:cysteine desulfurase [Eubacteriaceae bacterium]
MFYLDNAATSPLHPDVKETMTRAFDLFGNPSSLYDLGIDNEKRINVAKQTIAGEIGAKPEEIFFTSGGTEGDNMLIKGVIENTRRDILSRSRIITTSIEHPAVKDVFKMYENHGIDVVWLPVDSQGYVDLDAFRDVMTANTILVSVIGVNNEIGTVQNLKEIGQIIKSINPRCFFHSDYVQGFMKHPVNVKACHIDGLTMCAHKINGPKGVGAVYLNRDFRIKPLLLGGGQEKGLRSGTENVLGILGFEAAVIVWKNPDIRIRLKEMKAMFSERLTKVSDVNIVSPETGSPAVLSASVKGVRGEVLLHSLERRGVYISTGSACSSHKKEKNAVLKAIGLAPEWIEGTIRISFSAVTRMSDARAAAQIIAEEIEMLRRLVRKD